jgi:hypothetical protein
MMELYSSLHSIFPHHNVDETEMLWYEIGTLCNGLTENKLYLHYQEQSINAV